MQKRLLIYHIQGPQILISWQVCNGSLSPILPKQVEADSATVFPPLTALNCWEQAMFRNLIGSFSNKPWVMTTYKLSTKGEINVLLFISGFSNTCCIVLTLLPKIWAVGIGWKQPCNLGQPFLCTVVYSHWQQWGDHIFAPSSQILFPIAEAKVISKNFVNADYICQRNQKIIKQLTTE